MSDLGTMEMTGAACSAVTAANGDRSRSATLCFDISQADLQRVSGFVSNEDVEAARRLLAALKRIHHSPKVKPACKAIETEWHNRAVVGETGRVVWSAAHLRTKYYEFVKSGGDWTICLNKAKAQVYRVEREANVNKRAAFVEFWRGLGERNQRDWSAAYDELIHIWKTGNSYTHRDLAAKQYTSIPGYATWPVAEGRTEHPAGWSYANLMRLVSDPYDQAAARVGYSKASQLRIPVLTTRTKLQFGQYVEFDDHEFNQKVLFQKKPMRPLGFGALEIFSASIPLIGFKPTLWDYEDEVKRKLTEREFMWFVVAYLTTVGYRADLGTELIVERGTAAIRTEFEQRLLDVTNGKVTAYRGGRHGRAAHAGQFNGRSKGNFKTKALVEGAWRMIDDQMASLPGQVGKDRDSSPEQLHGAEQYTASVFRQIEEIEKSGRTLTPEQLAMLQFPFPPFGIWREWAMDAVHRINTTRRHTLEGWDKLGFVQPIWRLSEGDPATDPTAQWLPHTSYLAIPAEKRAAIDAILHANPNLISTRRLSRKEVLDTGRSLLTRVPMELLPGLVGTENALNGGQPVPVRQGLISFECADIDPDPLKYFARRADGSFLPNDTEYVCFVNPYAPRELVACEQNREGKLTVAAVCPMYDRASRNDPQSITSAMGAQAAFEGQARVRLNLRHDDAARAKRAMKDGNDRILGEPRGVVAGPVPQVDDCTSDILND